MLKFKSAVVLAALFFFAACSDPGPLRIELVTAQTPATIQVLGLSDDQWFKAWSKFDTREQWQQVFRVSVAPDQPPMLGEYAIDGDRLVFTPMFPLDPGRQYHASFTPEGGAPIVATVGLPAVHTTPTTTVAEIFPSGDVIPENQLRLYIHFSAPMGMKGGLEYVHLLDDQGKKV
ncbi:MAG TPA: hypothetical protein VF239_17295, partial [Vicinamibacterales bacterium]